MNDKLQNYIDVFQIRDKFDIVANGRPITDDYMKSL